MCSNNPSSMKIVKIPVLHARTKHIELRHHYIRERVEEQEVVVSQFHTREQEAYVPMKPLAGYIFKKCMGS